MLLSMLTAIKYIDLYQRDCCYCDSLLFLVKHHTSCGMALPQRWFGLNQPPALCGQSNALQFNDKRQLQRVTGRSMSPAHNQL